MNLSEYKLSTLGIDKVKFGRIICIVDFANVNHWFERDETGADGARLPDNTMLIVEIDKLGSFIDDFATQKRFYYGYIERDPSTLHLVKKAENCGFIKITKPVQFIKHYLNTAEIKNENPEKVHIDVRGSYIEIPKGNFDVEIAVDCIRKIETYETLCLLSGDSDFATLAQYLKKKKKQIIIIAAGSVFHTLKDTADLYINAQRIKQDITITKARPLRGGEALKSDPARQDKVARATET